MPHKFFRVSSALLMSLLMTLIGTLLGTVSGTTLVSSSKWSESFIGDVMAVDTLHSPGGAHRSPAGRKMIVWRLKILVRYNDG